VLCFNGIIKVIPFYTVFLYKAEGRSGQISAHEKFSTTIGHVKISFNIGLYEFSRRGLGIFLFTTASRTALGPTQPPIQRVPGALSLGVKQLGREADHSPPSSAEVKE
jgi:hypothetical protein